jgi:hypothetical protein
MGQTIEPDEFHKSFIKPLTTKNNLVVFVQDRVRHYLLLIEISINHYALTPFTSRVMNLNLGQVVSYFMEKYTEDDFVYKICITVSVFVIKNIMITFQ